MVNKRGGMKFDIVISLILGLVILTISLYWIFGEFFNEGEIDREVCRQSILLRASLPDKDLLTVNVDAKDAFPLKCKTEVLTVDSYKGQGELYGKISNTVAEGWYMFGEGKLDFIHRDVNNVNVYCMVFARVHYTQDAIDEFLEAEDINIDNIDNYFDMIRDNDLDAVSGRGSRDLMKHIAFRDNFVEYYSNNGIKDLGRRYEEYLPIFGSSENHFVLSEETKFYPSSDDLLFVYRTGKLGSIVLRVAEIFNIDKAAKLEASKFIYVVSPDDLDRIKCTEFLTIPA